MDGGPIPDGDQKPSASAGSASGSASRSHHGVQNLSCRKWTKEEDELVKKMFLEIRAKRGKDTLSEDMWREIAAAVSEKFGNSRSWTTCVNRPILKELKGGAKKLHFGPYLIILDSGEEIEVNTASALSKELKKPPYNYSIYDNALSVCEYVLEL